MYYSIHGIPFEERQINIFKTRNFARWAKKEKITDDNLKGVVRELDTGLAGASLGSGLFKQRIARHGQGKRGGYRVLLAFVSKERMVFIFGFSKNDRENLKSDEKEMYKKIAEMYLKAPIQKLKSMCKNGGLIEVL